MSAAALALAAALLVAPCSIRRRVRSLIPARPGHARVPAAAGGAIIAAAVAAVAAVALPGAAVVAIGLLAATLFTRRRSARHRQQGRDEAAELQCALDVLVGELRIGAHPVAAIEAAASESDGRVARALRGVAARAVLGADVVAGLRAEARRSRVPAHWDRLAVCWELAQTHGLAIASLMQAARCDLVERERFRGRVEAGLAGARATAAVLAGLPALGVLMGCAIGAEPLGFLMSPGPGGWFLLVGTLLICAGLLWSDRITARVLA